MPSTKTLSWHDFKKAVGDLADAVHETNSFNYLYGIPTGGSVVALELSHLLGATMLSSHINTKDRLLVVDDICDSGKTLAPFVRQGLPTLALVAKQRGREALGRGAPTFVGELVPDDTWVVFPYERQGQGGEEVVTRMIQLIGDDPNREGLRDTPVRVLRSWEEMFKGYQEPDFSVAEFSEEYDQMIVVRDIDVFSHCEHHILPFAGKAHVAYIPRKKVLGLSKIPRLVDHYARRLQIQERLTNQIAQGMQDAVDPLGVGVVIAAKHFCMMARGVKQSSPTMVTSAVLGALREEGPARQEFMDLVRASK